MADRLATWNCPECGGVIFYWHFTDSDGKTHCAELPSLPDYSALEAAKAKAREETEKYG